MQIRPVSQPARGPVGKGGVVCKMSSTQKKNSSALAYSSRSSLLCEVYAYEGPLALWEWNGRGPWAGSGAGLVGGVRQPTTKLGSPRRTKTFLYPSFLRQGAVIERKEGRMLRRFFVQGSLKRVEASFAGFEWRSIHTEIERSSGCSTLLKTIAGETSGYHVDKNTTINYQGISMNQMHKDFRGECIYQAEVDVHFPQLTVGQTLEFAARARGEIRVLQLLVTGAYSSQHRGIGSLVSPETSMLHT